MKNDHLGAVEKEPVSHTQESLRCEYWVLCDGLLMQCWFQPHVAGDHSDVYGHSHPQEEWAREGQHAVWPIKRMTLAEFKEMYPDGKYRT